MIHSKKQNEQFDDNIQKMFTGTTVEIEFRERFYELSDGRRAYYFAVIVPEIQKAYAATGVVKSKAEVDTEMRERFLFYEELNTESGEYESCVHTLRKGETKVSRRMMQECCDMCIIWAAQNLDWAIPFPNEEMLAEYMTEKQKHKENLNTDKSTF